MTSVRTVHRQFGSKARTAHELLRLVPNSGITIWAEVFAGTAALTLAKDPHPAEHINDINGDVVNLFQVLRDDTLRDRLCELLEFTPWAQAEFEACRASTQSADPVEQARRFLVASWQAVGGKQSASASWRLQRDKGWCMGTWSRVPERIRVAALRLKEVYVHRRHCMDMVAMFSDRPDACLFIDPPYPQETLATSGALYAVSMCPSEHADFAALLRTVKAKVIMTMNPGTLYEDELADWHRQDLRVRGLRNAVKSELVFTNFQPTADLFGGAA